MLDSVLGRFRRRRLPRHRASAVRTSPPPPPPIPPMRTPPPPPPQAVPGVSASDPGAQQAAGGGREGPEGPRVRLMFDDGSVATSLDDPEQREQLGYIIKNLFPPS